MNYGPYPATLLRIIDGDTIVVSIDLGFSITRQEQHVRIAHIDAPELSTPEGKVARDYAKTLLATGMPLRLMSYSLDKYGRILGTIRYPDATGQNPDWNVWADFGDAMIAASHAVPYEGGAR